MKIQYDYNEIDGPIINRLQRLFGVIYPEGQCIHWEWQSGEDGGTATLTFDRSNPMQQDLTSDVIEAGLRNPRKVT